MTPSVAFKRTIFWRLVVQHCIGGWRRNLGDEVQKQGTREWFIGLVAASPRAVTPSVAFKRTIFRGGGGAFASVGGAGRWVTKLGTRALYSHIHPTQPS